MALINVPFVVYLYIASVSESATIKSKVTGVIASPNAPETPVRL